MIMVDKSYILGKLTHHLEQLVAELNKTLIDLKSESDLPEDESIDPEDSSYQNYNSEMIQHYRSLLNLSVADLEKLRSFGNQATDLIGPGALIITDLVLIFVGVAIPKLHLKEHQTLLGISIDSPIYQALRSKKVGELFEFEEKELKIKNII